MFRTLRRFMLTLLALSLLALGACAPQALKIQVSGDDEVTFNALTESHAVTITAFDRDGQEIKSPSLRWYSINPRVADVSTSGLIVPKTDGKTKIVVRSGYAQKEIAVQVHLYAKLVPSKRSLVLPVGGYETLTAQVLDGRGEVIDEVPFTWTSKSPELVQIDKDGTMYGVKKGKAAVVVTAKNLAEEIQVEVVPSGDAPSM